MLTNDEIARHKLIFHNGGQPVSAADCRSSGYDLKIGTIICHKGELHESYTLEAGGIAHIVSEEVVDLPADITALAHVMTRLCNLGLLTLNIGVVDPGWKNCLGTSIINFSNVPKLLTRRDPFLRLSFFRLAATPSAMASGQNTSPTQYARDVQDRATRSFSNKFLNLDEFAAQIAKKQNASMVAGLVKYGSIAAVVIALVTLILGSGLTWIVRTIEQPPVETKGQIELLIRQNGDLQGKISSLESLQRDQAAQSQSLRSELQKIQQAKQASDAAMQKPTSHVDGKNTH